MRILIPTIMIPLIVLLLYVFVPGIKEPPWTALRIGGAILAVIAYGLVTTARLQLGNSFAVRPEAMELVTRGFYARIRNPMYIFGDLMVFGLILVMKVYWLFAILALLAVFQVLQTQREVKVLQEQFGRQYLEYRKQTWF